MKFSVCIPNYNYEAYLGETLRSVLESEYSDFEVVISDNASTDRSTTIVRNVQDMHPNVRLQVNACNVGFAANLDHSGKMAAGDYMIMLSSDDVMTSHALSVYDKVTVQYPAAVICSSCEIIDSEGNIIGFTGPNRHLWTVSDVDPALSDELGCVVYKVDASILLRRCLESMATPFNFCATVYQRVWYDRVGGYGAGRLINPDKWFHWKLLTVADEAIFIDRGLFKYRWHNQNQTSQQRRAGHLKYMVDEYRNVMEISDAMLKRSGLTRDAFERAFIRRDVYRHGIGEFAKGRWLKSVRIFFFGLSSFPKQMIFTLYFLPFFLLVLSSPVGSLMVHSIYRFWSKER